MDTTTQFINLEELLAPIAGDNPAGEDLSFDPVFDEIKEARRADDPNLSQGEWQSELKVADWRKAKELSIEVLRTRSKDYQVACWLAEALAKLHGFAGLDEGLRLLVGLTEQYWDSIHPVVEDGDLDPRASRFAWLDANLGPAVAELPLTSPLAGGYGLRRNREAREVDNLGRQGQELMDAALSEGKINSELWYKAEVQTPAAFYQDLLPVLERCRGSFQELDRLLGEKFGLDAPSLKRLQDSIDGACQLVGRIAKERGLGVGEAPPQAGGEVPAEEQGAGAGAAPAARAGGGPAGPPQSRAEALRRLSEAAEYFRRNEPHSPVAFLVDRAVRWGNMGLDQWLAEVVKDQATLDTVRELLGVTGAQSPGDSGASSS